MTLRPAVETVRIDDPIQLDGRQTTLRAEHGLGNVALVRGNLGVRPHKEPLAYWAVVRMGSGGAERFRICVEDFRLLSGRVLRRPGLSSFRKTAKRRR